MTRFRLAPRQFEPGNNSADANRLLDRLEHLQRLDFPEGLFADVPAHRITRLRRQGERYFADGLRELPENRRLAILAVCAVEWEMFLADAVVETHDRIVGRTYRTAVRTCEAQLGDETAAVREALRSFADLGSALLDARDTGAALDAVIATRPGWEGLGDLVATAAALANTVVSDPLNHVLVGYSRFRRYTPRMLRTPATSGWRGRAATATSERRCCRLLPSLMPTAACRSRPVRTIGSPSAGSPWTRACAGWPPQRGAGAIAGGSIEDSVLRVERTEAAVPDGAADLVADLYRRMPEVRITDILLEVDDATRFTEAFTHLRTGEPCHDRIGLLNVLLAEGINLGLRKMAEATTTHGFWELMRIARWHVGSSTRAE